MQQKKSNYYADAIAPFYRQTATSPYSVAASLFLILAGCKPSVPAGSDTKFAHGEDDFVNSSLAVVPPNSTISLCGQGGVTPETIDLVKKAVLAWAEPIQRDKYLKIDENCDARFIINVTMGTGADRYCAGGAAAFAGPDTVNNGNQGKWSITVCKYRNDLNAGPPAPENYFATQFDVLGHEVGHLWGQCDRYTNTTTGATAHPTRGLSCADLGQGSDGNYTAPSLMQSAGPQNPKRVTEDDANGMVALAKRTDIPSNQAWIDFLKTNPSPLNPSSSPSTNSNRETLGNSAISHTDDSYAMPADPFTPSTPVPQRVPVVTTSICKERNTLPQIKWSDEAKACANHPTCNFNALILCLM